MYHKYVFILFSSVVFLSQCLFAQAQTTHKNEIHALIKKVKTVEYSQRRVLMNKLKVMLRSVHQETRKQVMLDLRQSFKHQKNTHVGQRNHHKATHHQNMFSLTESKHMQEHTTQETRTESNPNTHKTATTPETQKPQNTPKDGH